MRTYLATTDKTAFGLLVLLGGVGQHLEADHEAAIAGGGLAGRKLGARNEVQGEIGRTIAGAAANGAAVFIAAHGTEIFFQEDMAAGEGAVE